MAVTQKQFTPSLFALLLLFYTTNLTSCVPDDSAGPSSPDAGDYDHGKADSWCGHHEQWACHGEQGIYCKDGFDLKADKKCYTAEDSDNDLEESCTAAKGELACQGPNGPWDLTCNQGCRPGSDKRCWGSCALPNKNDDIIPPPTSSGHQKIVLLGDSNTAITYAASKGIVRWSDRLQSNMGSRATVLNHGVGDQRVEDFLDNGFGWTVDGDIYVIAFTVNDARKNFYISGAPYANNLSGAVAHFKNKTEELIEEIRLNSPRAKVILMSAAWADYTGGHYSYDVDMQSDAYTNALIEISNSTSRTWMLDIFNLMRTTNSWDTRLRRGNVTGTPSTDAQGTAQFGRHWFTNIHFNQAGNNFVAYRLTRLLSEVL